MRGYKKERGANHWRLCVFLGVDPDTGKERRKWKTVVGSERVAQRELNKMLAAAQAGQLAPSSHLTVEQYFDRFLRDYAKPTVGAATFERYKAIADNMIVPALGRYRLEHVKPAHLQTAYSKWLESGRRPRKYKIPKKLRPSGTVSKLRKPETKGLSPRTVVHAHRLLHLAFKTAMRWQLVAGNPVSLVKPPRVTRSERDVPSEAQTMAFLAEIRGTRLAIPVVLAAYGGLRRGEILALTWPDVDFRRGTLRVARSLEHVDGTDRVTQTKTAGSRRSIPLPKAALAALADLKEEQGRMAHALGPAYVATDYICVHEDGRRWTLDGLTCSFRKAAHSAKFPGRFHDLRHAHATWLVRQGVHPRIIAERLGHRSTNLTLDTYSHVLEGMQEAAVLKLERALRKASVDKPLTSARKTKKASPRKLRKPA